MARKSTKVVFDAWNTYVRQTDEGPIFISFDDEAARKDLTNTLTHCARIFIKIHKPGTSGGPDRPENERLWEMEDQLCQLLSSEGIKCRLVGRLTHWGQRVLVFQLDDWDEFRPPVGYWMTQCSDYEIDVDESEGWEIFDDCVRPQKEDWLFIADADVVHNLLKAGSNPQKEHALEFVFLGEAEPLRKLTKALKERGYQPLKSNDAAAGRMVQVKKMKLEIPAIAAESVALSQLAAEHGVEYDGWGAAVVR
jgi:regulator of RNase E activity RraB